METDNKLSLRNIIGTIILVISLITGILTINNHYASADDVKKLEIRLVQTLETFQQNQIKNQFLQRFINLTDQAMQMKNMVRKNPKDKELKEDYDKVEQQRQEAKQLMGK